MPKRPWKRPAVRPEPLARAALVADLVRTAIERDGEAHWQATGTSMGASIRSGTTLRLIAPDQFEAGDVVMAVLPGERLVLHRVKHVDAHAVTLQGDGCRRPDPQIRPDDVIARAIPTPKFAMTSHLYRLVT